VTALHDDISDHLLQGDEPSERAGSGAGGDAPPPSGGRGGGGGGGDGGGADGGRGDGRRRGRLRRRRRPIDTGLLVVSLVIGFGLFLVIRGLAVGISGDDRVPLPELIEEVDPVPEAVQVPNQTRVFVDLETGYTGVLVIDGIEIETVSIRDLARNQNVGPGQQLELPPVTVYEGGNNTLTFVPNEDAPITEFTTGEHRAQVIYWQEEVGRQRAKSFSWTFNVV
jgi:hypothetical protein